MPDLAQAARAIFASTLAGCGVEEAFSQAFAPGGFRLDGVKRVLVISIGKGGATMAQGLLKGFPLPEGCRVEGVVIAPEEHNTGRLPEGMRFFAGGHPFPNEASFEGARAVLDLLAGAEWDDVCLFLISGGASAMMELPLDPSISLADTIAFHRALVLSGASIAEINCVRKHFSAVKGGRLGLRAANMPTATLLVSDVPAAHLDALASGPTLPDPSTVADCRAILAKHGLLAQFPASVRAFFEAEELPETPKPGDFDRTDRTLLSSDQMAEAAVQAAEQMGFHTVVDNTCDDWDYRDAAAYLLDRLRGLREAHGRVCLISAGEVTVKVTDEIVAGAQGGRNQHFALYAATLIQPDAGSIAIFSGGSDGVDGNSPAAGAVLSSGSLAEKMEAAEEALRGFNSFPFLDRLGATVHTGPTGNNLRDLRILLAE